MASCRLIALQELIDLQDLWLPAVHPYYPRLIVLLDCFRSNSPVKRAQTTLSLPAHFPGRCGGQVPLEVRLESVRRGRRASGQEQGGSFPTQGLAIGGDLPLYRPGEQERVLAFWEPQVPNSMGERGPGQARLGKRPSGLFRPKNAADGIGGKLVGERGSGP